MKIRAMTSIVALSQGGFRCHRQGTGRQAPAGGWVAAPLNPDQVRNDAGRVGWLCIGESGPRQEAKPAQRGELTRGASPSLFAPLSRRSAPAGEGTGGEGDVTKEIAGRDCFVAHLKLAPRNDKWKGLEEPATLTFDFPSQSPCSIMRTANASALPARRPRSGRPDLPVPNVWA